MAAVTPTTTQIISLGNVKGILATFHSALGATDTWATGMSTVLAVFFTDGVAGTVSPGATYSGGTVTFALSGAAGADSKVLAIGF